MVLQKYHWTFEYVMWGISYTNINMLLSDTINTYYNKSGEQDVIDADDPANADFVKQTIGIK